MNLTKEQISDETLVMVESQAKLNGLSIDQYLRSLMPNANGKNKPFTENTSSADQPVTNMAKSEMWLEVNRDAYRGKWVVLNGDVLIGATDDPVPVVAEARKNGVAVPFVTYIESTSEPVWMGWL